MATRKQYVPGSPSTIIACPRSHASFRLTLNAKEALAQFSALFLHRGISYLIDFATLNARGPLLSSQILERDMARTQLALDVLFQSSVAYHHITRSPKTQRAAAPNFIGQHNDPPLWQ